MKKPETITNGDDSRIWLKSPYNRDLVAELKARIPAREREWSPPYWKVAAQHLEALRELAQLFATREGWQLYDQTAQSAEEIALQKQAVLENYLERHVAAVLAVLPKLPPRALSLVAWKDDHLVLELRTFLGEALFRELREASLDAYRPTVRYGGAHKREFSHTFLVASDERLVRHLCALAGAARSGLSFSGVENLVVRPLSLTRLFDDGRIAHFKAEDGSFWVGERYQDVDVASWNWSRRPWEILPTDHGAYIVFQREKLIEEFLEDPGWSYFAPASGFAVAPPERSSQVAWLVCHLHLEEWFRGWAATVAANATVQVNRWGSKEHWYDHDWDHPADPLLNHLARTHRPKVADVLMLLGWTREDVVTHQAHAQQLKEQAVALRLAEMRAHARELAQPLLETKTVTKLLEMGAVYGLAPKKTARKAELVARLAAHQQCAEDLIGLTKRLGKETATRPNGGER